MRNPRRRNTPNSVGEDPLHQAARSGDLQSVQSICSSDPLAINSRDKHSRTPLHLAAWSGQTEVVSYLCKHKADVGAAAMDDMGAIHFAAQKGHLEVVRTLLTSGVSIKSSNRKGLTPLHYAAQGSHMELVKYLVRKGASLTAKTKAGKTPLDLANEEVRSFFIECETSLKKGEDQADQGKTEEFAPKPSVEDKVIGPDDETVTKCEDKEEEEDHKDEKEKRKNEDVEIEGNLLKPKKARIALSHLQAGDYTQEDEN